MIIHSPDPLKSNVALAQKGSKGKAGGLRRLPLLLFGLGIVLVGLGIEFSGRIEMKRACEYVA